MVKVVLLRSLLKVVLEQQTNVRDLGISRSGHY